MKPVFLIVFASCWTTPATPPASPASPVSPAATSSVLGKPLAGPFATLAAYCEDKPQDTCQIWDTAKENVKAGLAGSGMTEVNIIYSARQPGDSFRCAIALRTAAGWFVTSPSKETCREPSYIEVRGVRVAVDDTVLTVEIDVNWHTKPPYNGQGDAYANYTITSFCNADPLVCVPPFTSKCDATAPASDCSDEGYEATWTIDGPTLKLSSSSKNAAVPNGTHRLF